MVLTIGEFSRLTHLSVRTLRRYHDAGLLVHAVGLTNWHATHTRCPRCGAPTEVVRGGSVRRCPQDGSDHFPRTDPAVIMLVHEPNAFRHMSDRISLSLSGHTHGGQIVVPGLGPIVTPSRRYNYGHIVEDGRHLIVSGGLGESGVPARLGVPPEILDVTVSNPAPIA